jgi:hypothetical protein
MLLVAAPSLTAPLSLLPLPAICLEKAESPCLPSGGEAQTPPRLSLLLSTALWRPQRPRASVLLRLLRLLLLSPLSSAIRPSTHAGRPALGTDPSSCW